MKIVAIILGLCLIGCEDAVPSYKSFTGPIFEQQLTTDTLAWAYNSGENRFQYHQARTAESFLFREVSGHASLDVMLPLPVHGGGLMAKYDEQEISLSVDMDQVTWTSNETEDSLQISLSDYPINLAIHLDPSSVELLVTLKDQMSTSVLSVDRTVDSLQLGLLVKGFGGFSFENVRLTNPSFNNAITDKDGSEIEVLYLESRRRQVLYRSDQSIHGLYWSSQGSHLYFVEGKALRRMSLADESIATVPVHEMDALWGGSLQPDGSVLALSAERKGFTQLYLMSVGGGQAKLRVARAPTYFSSWTPDGERLCYTAARRGKQLDIFQTSRTWGRELRLTQHDSLDAGASVTPNGNSIYFHSNRSGNMKIWRMDIDGKNKSQLTTDKDWDDWYPQPSPDGRFLLVHSTQESRGGEEVFLRLFSIDAPTTNVRVLGSYGGDLSKPTFNAWSTEGDRIAYISR
ncbi:MAG: hypothetical protein HKN87_07745 [Saprospiraceae bacterium]|nr:hypothetical protein [Saprospiraceae bacterium]